MLYEVITKFCKDRPLRTFFKRHFALLISAEKGITLMLHFDESMKLIDELTMSYHKTKKIYLTKALGYVLAEDIVADHNSPAFPTSAMDGYALRYEDMESYNFV